MTFKVTAEFKRMLGQGQVETETFTVTGHRKAHKAAENVENYIINYYRGFDIKILSVTTA